MTSGGFDLAVVGAGVIGLAHAYMAAKAGKRVAVIERDVRANGASIRNFGFITVTGQERGDSWHLARRTRDVWADVAARANIPIEQRGLYLTARSAEAIAVIEAFLATEMGEGCDLLSSDEFRARASGLGGLDLQGALFSPHELRVESRKAIRTLTNWLQEALGVTVFNETVVFEAAPPRLATSRGAIEAGAVVVCPGDDFSTLYPERIAAYGLGRCRLSMLKLADPGFRLPGALMSDLSLARYRGYAALPQARALEARLRAKQPRALENGVHLIVAQGADGGLIVGDSHHYDRLPEPFAPAQASRSDFTYDHADDLYRCPGGQVLQRNRRAFSTPRHNPPPDDTYRYRASKAACDACELKPRCCPNTPARKVTRSIYEGARDFARDIATTDAYVTSRRERKKVEMLFAHLKRILKLDRLRLRGPCGASDEFLLAATAQNLRKLAKLIPPPAPAMA